MRASIVTLTAALALSTPGTGSRAHAEGRRHAPIHIIGMAGYELAPGESDEGVVAGLSADYTGMALSLELDYRQFVVESPVPEGTLRQTRSSGLASLGLRLTTRGFDSQASWHRYLYGYLGGSAGLGMIETLTSIGLRGEFAVAAAAQIRVPLFEQTVGVEARIERGLVREPRILAPTVLTFALVWMGRVPPHPRR